MHNFALPNLACKSVNRVPVDSIEQIKEIQVKINVSHSFSLHAIMSFIAAYLNVNLSKFL